jgi:hypothetical protein
MGWNLIDFSLPVYYFLKIGKITCTGIFHLQYTRSTIIMVKPVCAANTPEQLRVVPIRFVREVLSLFYEKLSQEVIF